MHCANHPSYIKKFPDQGAFCPHCGEPLAAMRTMQMKKASLSDLLPEEFEDDLYWVLRDRTPQNLLLVIGNKNAQDRVFHQVSLGFAEIDDDIDFYIRSFEIKYKAALDALRAKATSVTVCFGVITFDY